MGAAHTLTNPRHLRMAAWAFFMPMPGKLARKSHPVITHSCRMQQWMSGQATSAANVCLGLVARHFEYQQSALMFRAEYQPAAMDVRAGHLLGQEADMLVIVGCV